MCLMECCLRTQPPPPGIRLHVHPDGIMRMAPAPFPCTTVSGDRALACAAARAQALPPMAKPLFENDESEMAEDCFEDCQEEAATDVGSEAATESGFMTPKSQGSLRSCVLSGGHHHSSASGSLIPTPEQSAPGTPRGSLGASSSAALGSGFSTPTESGQATPVSVDWSFFHGSLPRGVLDSPQRQNCWMVPETGGFTVKGKTFFEDGALVPAGEPLCQLAAVDWLRADQPMERVASRQGSVVQRVLQEHRDGAPFFIVVNLKIPSGGADHYSLVCYFALPRGSLALAPGTPLHRFIFCDDDEFRRSRLMLIPAVPEGSWLIRSAVGTGQCVPVAQVLETTFERDSACLEIGVSMGSSAVVRGIVGLALTCISLLTVDLAFLVKAEESDELPEQLLGSLRCCNLELAQTAPFSGLL